MPGKVVTLAGIDHELRIAAHLREASEFFPKYNVAPVLTEQVVKDFPQVKDLLAPVAEKITDDVLIDLNAQVDVDGKEPGQVAHDWLAEEGFIS